MITSVVVALDLEAAGDRALPIAAALAEAADLPLELVTVSSPGVPSNIDAYELDVRIRRWCPERGAVVLLHDDDVAAALLRHLAERPDALLVMATHARSTVVASLLGSVSESVLDATHQPVLLVGPKVEATTLGSPPLLIVAVDSQASADVLLPVIEAWTHAFHASPWVVHVHPPVQAADAQGPGAPDPDVARQFVADLDARGIKASYDTAEAHLVLRALRSMVDSTADAVVATASQHWTDPGVHLAASITRALARQSRHPILVVPLRASEPSVAPTEPPA